MSKPRSFSLAAYRVLSWGVPKTGGQQQQARPDGELLWVHVNSHLRLRVVDEFCHRLTRSRPDLSVLITAPYGADLALWADSTFPVVSLPAEQTGAVRGFLEHWRPDIGVWVGGGLVPNLITQAEENGIPLILVEAQVDVVIPRGARWLPDLARYTFDCFHTILTTTPEAARQIRRLGIHSAKVTESPPLHISPNPRPWPEDELIETNHVLAGRPVWLASCVQDKEFISVLSAHRQALRMLPRLALVLHVADASEAPPLHRRLAAMDLRCVNWDNGEPIEDTTQVILSAEREDLGLWQRVAAVTFAGSSLEKGMGGHDPLEAVALGSAVIHGPFVHRHQELYDSLDMVDAARTVRTATELGDAVEELLAPDRAADMALAGWQIVTEGAPQADRLIDLVQDLLDLRRTQHAGT